MPIAPEFSAPWRSLLKDFFSDAPPKPLIAIVGPTCSGKTAFSIEVAKELESSGLHPEVINADSRQFYRYLDVGTAKITQSEMQRIPHHLLSVLDPNEECSIAWFQKQAEAVIEDIRVRGYIPMLVGGSMLYVSALIDGYEPVSPVDPAIRERLLREYDQDGGITLLQKLREIDPDSAASIPRQNKVYLVRALEIWEATGQPKSSVMKKKESLYDLLMIGMDVDLPTLRERISKRTRAMLQGGWIEEVKILQELGYTHDDPGMESHGYREILAALERGDIDREKLALDISKKTSQYAKRSITWWKREKRIHWITPPSN